MSSRFLHFYAAAAAVLLQGSAGAQQPASTSATALTIYSSARPGAIPPELYRHGGPGQNVPGYAVVRQERELKLDKGRNAVRYTDVAALIDPTTVAFESLTDARGTTVVEQNFQFDLVNTAKLMEKLCRPRDHRGADPRQRGRIFHGHAPLDGRRSGLAPFGRHDTDAAAQRRRQAAGAPWRPHHAADPGLGHRGEPPWGASDARFVPDERHHVVGRLQRDLQ
jgi:hypothetical protein